MLDIPRKATLAQVGETVVSRCFVGCLGQARKRYSNRCCCGPRNYASDVWPTDPFVASVVPKSDPSSWSCVLHYYCRAKIYFKNQPSDRGRLSLVRHVKCLTFFHRIFYVENNLHVKNRRSRRQISLHARHFSTLDLISLHFVAAKNGPY